jgi:hypothetical protein
MAADATWWMQGQRHIKLLATEVTRMRIEIQVVISLFCCIVFCFRHRCYAIVIVESAPVYWHRFGINLSPPTRVGSGVGEQAGLEERR